MPLTLPATRAAAHLCPRCQQDGTEERRDTDKRTRIGVIVYRCAHCKSFWYVAYDTTKGDL